MNQYEVRISICGEYQMSEEFIFTASSVKEALALANSFSIMDGDTPLPSTLKIVSSHICVEEIREEESS